MRAADLHKTALALGSVGLAALLLLDAPSASASLVIPDSRCSWRAPRPPIGEPCVELPVKRPCPSTPGSIESLRSARRAI